VSRRVRGIAKLCNALGVRATLQLTARGVRAAVLLTSRVAPVYRSTDYLYL
jgi:hypothetical protein